MDGEQSIFFLPLTDLYENSRLSQNLIWK